MPVCGVALEPRGQVALGQAQAGGFFLKDSGGASFARVAALAAEMMHSQPVFDAPALPCREPERNWPRRSRVKSYRD